jgi:hypothetical protein
MSQPEQNNELPPEPCALDEFLKDTTAASDVRAFLVSESGRKFRGLLMAMHPMKGLCEPRTLRPESVRVLATVEGPNAASILSLCRGYGTAVELIESLRLPPARKPDPPQTRKAGRTIPPHITST